MYTTHVDIVFKYSLFFPIMKQQGLNWYDLIWWKSKKKKQNHWVQPLSEHKLFLVGFA